MKGIERKENNYSFSFPVQELLRLKQSFQNIPSKQRMHSSAVEVVTKPAEC